MSAKIRDRWPLWAVWSFNCIVVWGVVIGFPRWATDWFWRPQFMQACVGGKIFDDRQIAGCDIAYERFRNLQASGWKP